MTKSELKEKLLNLDIFENNKYFEDYLDLIIKNLDTIKVEYHTEAHHIIPKCYYVKKSLKVNNKKDNIVYLLDTDHIRAHGLLFLCGKDWFALKNYWAVIYLLGNKDLTKEDLGNIFESEETFQDYIAKVSTTYIFTDEHKKKISESMRGNKNCAGRKVLWGPDGKKRIVPPEQVDELLAQGYLLPTNKRKVSEDQWNPYQTHTNQRRTDPELVRKHLSESHLGHIPSNKGVPCSEDTKKKLADSIRGRKWVNNGKIQKQVKPEDVEKYLNEGFVLGPLKRR